MPWTTACTKPCPAVVSSLAALEIHIRHIPPLRMFTYPTANSLSLSLSMSRGWRFFMIKLWNHSLLDARAMNACNTILQGYQDGSADPK